MAETGMGVAGMKKHQVYGGFTVQPVYVDLPEMSVEKMNKTMPQNTICEILRILHIKAEDEEIKKLARIAALMAKKMDAKLREYNKTWDEGWWK